MKRLDIGNWLHIYKPNEDLYSWKTHKHTVWTIRIELLGVRLHSFLTFDKAFEAPKDQVFVGKAGWVKKV